MRRHEFDEPVIKRRVIPDGPVLLTRAPFSVEPTALHISEITRVREECHWLIRVFLHLFSAYLTLQCFYFLGRSNPWLEVSGVGGTTRHGQACCLQGSLSALDAG